MLTEIHKQQYHILLPEKKINRKRIINLQLLLLVEFTKPTAKRQETETFNESTYFTRDFGNLAKDARKQA